VPVTPYIPKGKTQRSDWMFTTAAGYAILSIEETFSFLKPPVANPSHLASQNNVFTPNQIH
jgi:hypothetical protein